MYPNSLISCDCLNNLSPKITILTMFASPANHSGPKMQTTATFAIVVSRNSTTIASSWITALAIGITDGFSCFWSASQSTWSAYYCILFCKLLSSCKSGIHYKGKQKSWWRSGRCRSILSLLFYFTHQLCCFSWKVSSANSVEKSIFSNMPLPKPMKLQQLLSLLGRLKMHRAPSMISKAW